MMDALHYIIYVAGQTLRPILLQIPLQHSLKRIISQTLNVSERILSHSTLVDINLGYPPSLLGGKLCHEWSNAGVFRFQHVSHLWREHQTITVISPVEVNKDICGLRWLILMNEVTRLREDLKLVFAYVFCKTSFWIPLEHLNVPCICPIMSSLSKRSVPASNRSFPPLASRNFLLNPMNQSSQKGFVAARLVCHLYFREVLASSGSSWSKEGTETRADSELRIVRERVLWTGQQRTVNKGLGYTGCHSIPEATDGKPDGRVER